MYFDYSYPSTLLPLSHPSCRHSSTKPLPTLILYSGPLSFN